MYVLKESQQHAVDELFDYYLQYHHQKNDKPIYFQAPTGSGKTLILCSLCNKIMEHSDKCIILFVSISTGDIQEQNYEKAVNYQLANAFDYYPYLITSPSRNNPKAKIDIINHIPLTNHYVYFMGSSTYTKGSMFYTQQTFDSFIKEAKRQGYEIIYIRDEAHIGTSSRKTKDNDTKKLDKLLNDNANLTYYVSATLEQDHDIDVKVADIDAVNDGLIKGNEILYKGVNKNESITSAQLLDTALTEFKKIKKQYIDLGYGINPCLLIQIKNSKKEDKDKEQELIKSYKEAIDKHNLTYVVYTEDNKKESNTRHFNGKGNLTSEEKKLITANDSDIDVVIFKVALATGWDIPRANMLLQLREIYSDTLDIQTIGRIRRNPLARKLDLDTPEKILDNYYIYSNVPKVKNEEYQYLKRNIEVYPLEESFQTVILKEKEINKNKLEINQFYDGLINYLKTEKLFATNPSDSKTFHEIIIELNSEINKTNQYSLQRNELYLDEEHKNKIPLVTDKINNVLTLDKYWNEKVLSFNDNRFVGTINDFVNYYAAKELLNPYVIKLFLLDFKFHEVFSHILSQYNHLNDNNSYEYEPGPAFSLEKETMECLTEAKKDNKLTLKDNLLKYLYWIPDEVINDRDIDEKIDETVYNDSEGEKHFISEMLKVLNKEYNSNDQLKIYLLKNYLNNSNFRYEYIDTQPIIKIRNHYPDYMIKHGEDIYIFEIKSGMMDYDPKKTQELENAYLEYSKQSKLHPALSKYHYVLIKYNNDSLSFSWKHYFAGLLIDSKNNESDLSKVFRY